MHVILQAANRIKMHLTCPCRKLQHTRFHLAGIIRELLPKRLQIHIR